MQPIVQKEFYLAKAAGLYDGEVPNPVTTTDYYYAALCGKYVGELPEPVTAEQKYLANLLGEDVAVPKPITLDDIFMYDAVMRIVAEEPVTRQQYYWRLIAKSRQYINKTASGNPITLTDSAENKPLTMKLYGWSKQDGEPSPDNPVEIESAGGDGKIGVSVRGKNLFHITKESDCNKAYDNTTKRIILPGEYLVGLSQNNYHIVYDASIDLNTDSISFIYSWNSGYGVGIGTNCQKNKTYAFSFETNKGVAYAVFYSEDGAYKARVLVSKYNVFFIPDYVEHVVIVLTDNNGAVVGDTIWFKNVQIEEAKSITAYEPYRTPQSTAIVTPNGLQGIPVPSNTAGITYTDANGQAWIADEIDLEHGKYIQNVRIKELTGQESYMVAGTSYFSGSSANMYINVPDMIRDGEVMCNCLSKKPYVWTVKSAVGFATNLQQIHLRFPKAIIGVNDDAVFEDVKIAYKKYIKTLYDNGKPVVVQYILANSIERDLTSAELAEYIQLYSYKPTTVVENDSDCWMDVTALCKPK